MAAALKIADLPHSKMIDLISLDGAGYGQPPSLRSERRPVPRLRIRQLGHADAVIRAALKPQIQPGLLGMMRKPQFFPRSPHLFCHDLGTPKPSPDVTGDLIGTSRRLSAQSQLFPKLAGFQSSHNCLHSLFAAAETDLHFPSLLNKVSCKGSETFTRFSRMLASTRTLTHPSEGCQLTAFPALFSCQPTDNLALEWPSTGKSRR